MISGSTTASSIVAQDQLHAVTWRDILQSRPANLSTELR
jgi:hypothetical protein